MISIPDRKTTDLVLPRALGMREVRDYATPANEGSRTHVYGRRRPRGGAPRCCRAQYPCSRAGRGRRSPLSLSASPTPITAPGRAAAEPCRPADRLTGFTSGASTSGSRTASCSRSRPTVRASSWTGEQHPHHLAAVFVRREKGAECVKDQLARIQVSENASIAVVMVRPAISRGTGLPRSVVPFTIMVAF